MRPNRRKLIAIFLACLTGVLITLTLVVYLSFGDTRYRDILPIVDAERRTEAIETDVSDRLDLAAFDGMPNDYRRVVGDYIESILGGLGVRSLVRERYYHVDRSQSHFGAKFPDDVNLHRDKPISVPLTVLPRPEVVLKWTSSPRARATGWRAVTSSLRAPGSVFGRTLIFQPGEQSEEPFAFPAAPMGTSIPSCDEYIPGLYSHDVRFFRELGKIVVEPFFNGQGGQMNDGSERLRLGEVGGARLLAEILTVPPSLKNQRLRWALRRVGPQTEYFVAYALIDGNGANRASRDNWFQMSDSGLVSPYLRPLKCKRHQPMVNQHDLLLLPVPIGWPPRLGDGPQQHSHEEWCLDDWFPAQPEACWVIREAENSKPLQESFLLMPAEEPSDRPVFFVAIFAETEPQRLVKELAALYSVPDEKVLGSTAKMARLQQLYDDLRTFDVSQQ